MDSSKEGPPPAETRMLGFVLVGVIAFFGTLATIGFIWLLFQFGH